MSANDGENTPQYNEFDLEDLEVVNSDDENQGIGEHLQQNNNNYRVSHQLKILNDQIRVRMIKRSKRMTMSSSSMSRTRMMTIQEINLVMGLLTVRTDGQTGNQHLVSLKPDCHGVRYHEEDKEEMDDEDFMNPMAIKLRKMRLELRGKLDAAPVRSENANLKNEDMQGYDTYKSPLARQKLEFGLKSTKPPQQAQNTESSEPNFKFQEGVQTAAVNPIKTSSVIQTSTSNFDKIKGSKLFQKFLQKEQGNKKPENTSIIAAPTVFKGSSNNFTFQQKKSEAISFMPSPQPSARESKQEDIKMYQAAAEDPHFNQSEIQHMEDDEEGIDNMIKGSPGNNEGELVGYSEQIIGKISDMAPGIPNQDEVLLNHPDNHNPYQYPNYGGGIQWINQVASQQRQFEQYQQQESSNFDDYAPNAAAPQRPPPLDPKLIDFYPETGDLLDRGDADQMRQEMIQMREDYDLMNERFLKMKDQYEKQEEEHQKDKQFYDEALEARMNQLEQLENENAVLSNKVEGSRQREIDLQAQIEQLEFDLDMMRRKGGAGGSQANFDREIKNMQEQIQDRDFEIDRMRNENMRLKHEIDRASQEIDKMHSKSEFQEQVLMQKDQEKGLMQAQISELKSKLQSEQTEQHFIKGENSELKNEVMMLKSQLNISTNVQEQLRQQVFEFKEKINEIEHKEFLANSSKEMMQREIQQLRTQLQQANQFIQQQQQMMMLGGGQVSGGMSSRPKINMPMDRSWEQDDMGNMSGNNNSMDYNSRGKSREAAVPHINPSIKRDSPSQNEMPNNLGVNSRSRPGQARNRDMEGGLSSSSSVQASQNQLKSNNIGSILQWDEQPVGGGKPAGIPKPQKTNRVEQFDEFPQSKKQVQQENSSIAFPSRMNNNDNQRSGFQSYRDQEPTSQNIAFPSKMQQQQFARPTSSASQLPPDQSIYDQPFPPSKRKPIPQAPSANPITTNTQQQALYPARNQQQVTTLNKEQFELKQKQVANIENNLLQLNLERDKFKNEFDKIPENPKTMIQKRRKEDLERELGILNKNIASLKTKLRELDAI